MRTVNSYLKLPRFPDRIQLFFRQPLESSFAIEGNSLAFVEIGFHEKIFEVERLFLHRRGRCTFVVVKVKYVGQRVPSCILWTENFRGVVLLVINSFFLGGSQCFKIIQNVSLLKKIKDVKRDYWRNFHKMWWRKPTDFCRYYLPCCGSILLSMGGGRTMGKLFQCHKTRLASPMTRDMHFHVSAMHIFKHYTRPAISTDRC